MWVGEVDGGLNVNLKGEEAEWEVPFGMEAKVPPAWSGTGGGDVLVVDEGGAAVVRARAGAHKVSPTKPLTLRFSLLITPVRDRRSGLGAHASQRYYHTKYSDWDPPTAAEVGRLGANVVTLHQGNSLNPYINYPFFANATAALRGYIQRMHTAGRRVKLYFTTKELTSWATELPLFRELGTEIVTAADTLNHRRGSSYLQEQLSNYAAAWCTHSVKGSRGGRADLAFEDQALLVNGASRWCNYYVEGVRWVLRHLKLDGIYLDGIRFPREVSQRLRHVFAAAARARGGADTRAPLLDLHAGPNLRSFLEHTPYLDSLWVGENIEWGSGTPDYWLVAVSGLCWGLYSDMLGNADKEADAMRGMLFAMLARSGWAGSKPRENAKMWALWDDFGLGKAELIGWWEAELPVTLKESGAGAKRDVVVTVYRRRGEAALVVIGSWRRMGSRVGLAVDWGALGLTAATSRISVYRAGQERATDYGALDSLNVPAGGGVIVRIDGRNATGVSAPRGKGRGVARGARSTITRPPTFSRPTYSRSRSRGSSKPRVLQ